MLRIALDGYNVNGVRFVCVNVDHEAKIGREVSADFPPRIAGIVGAHHVPMLLHEKYLRTSSVHGDVMHAMAYVRGWIRNVLRIQSAVNWLPGLAGVIGAESAGRGDGNEDPLAIFRIENDGVKAHSSRARLPLRAGPVTAKTGEFLPVLCSIGGAE